MKLGIQLYTVRDALERDFCGALRAMAEMGFEAVEFAWQYGGLTPEELAAFLQETRLVCCGLHASLDDLLDAGSESYAYARAVASPFITTSCAGAVSDGIWPETVEQLRQAGQVARKNGLVFTYHHHWHEFGVVEDVYALDYLYEKTPADSVCAELDTAWIMKGNEDPVSYIRKHGDRTRQIHLKDFDRATNEVTELGRGCVDLPAIFQVAQEIGCQWLIYEQDQSTLGSSLESARTSLKYLKDTGLI